MTTDQSVPSAPSSFWNENDFVSKESLLDSGERFYVLNVESGIATGVGIKYRVEIRNERGTTGELMFGAEVKTRAVVLDAMQKWLREHKGGEIPARLSASGDKVTLISA